MILVRVQCSVQHLARHLQSLCGAPERCGQQGLALLVGLPGSGDGVRRPHGEEGALHQSEQEEARERACRTENAMHVEDSCSYPEHGSDIPLLLLHSL